MKLMQFKDFNEAFNEAFDKPYKWEVSDLNKYQDTYGFLTDNNIYYVVSIVKGEEHNILTFETEQGDMALTGKGDAFRVFATVLDIIKQNKHIKSRPLEFGASTREPSRVRLYIRMAKLLKKELGFKKLTIDKGVTVYFRLED